MDCPAADVLPQRLVSDTVTLFRTAVETAISGVHKFASQWRGPHLLNTVVLVVADGLFGLYGSERRDELFIGPPPPVSNP